MTKSELVQAYIRGDLDRRDFIRKLTAAGVSAGAAAVYATSLGHSTALAANRNAAGFVAGTQPDEDYGIAVIIENLLEALQTVVDILQRLIARLEQLLQGSMSRSSLVYARLQDNAAPVIADISSQMSDHVDALVAIYPDLTVAPAEVGAAQSEEETLEALADDANLLAGIYAALLPNLEDPEQRQTLTEIAIVGGRHASVLSHFAGLNPVPAAFEQAIDPATVQ
jgi:hypothetical protein